MLSWMKWSSKTKIQDFLTASKEEKDAYNLIFSKAKLLLENSEASQEEINAVINALKETTVKLKDNKVEIPTKPVVAVKPVDPTKEVAPVNPTKPVVTINPVNPAKPVVTIKPANPTKPVASIKGSFSKCNLLKLVSHNRQVSTIKAFN